VSHKSIRKLIEDTARGLQDDIHYSYGRETDFNQEHKHKLLMVNTSLLTATAQYRDNNVSNYMKQWTVQMAFYKFDVEASTAEEYSLILDQTDALVDQFINNLNLYSFKSDDIVLQGMNQQAFIKVLADCLTGHSLTFQMLVNDDFDYCRDC